MIEYSEILIKHRPIYYINKVPNMYILFNKKAIYFMFLIHIIQLVNIGMIHFNTT